jgi:hypothetical protein
LTGYCNLGRLLNKKDYVSTYVDKRNFIHISTYRQVENIHMVKYRFFQVIMALSLVILIISSALTCAFAVRDVSYADYSLGSGKTVTSVMNNGQTQELSEFEAWLEYSIVSDGLRADNEDGYRQGNIYLTTENVMRLETLKDIKAEASNGVFISIVALVVCFVVVRRRRLYQCIVWGGAAGVLVGLIGLAFTYFSKSGMLYGVRQMIFENDYSAMFPGHDVLAEIIPAGLGTRFLAVFVGTIVAGLVVTIIVRAISYNKSCPHRFR